MHTKTYYLEKQTRNLCHYCHLPFLRSLFLLINWSTMCIVPDCVQDKSFVYEETLSPSQILSIYSTTHNTPHIKYQCQSHTTIVMQEITLDYRTQSNNVFIEYFTVIIFLAFLSTLTVFCSLNYILSCIMCTSLTCHIHAFEIQ